MDKPPIKLDYATPQPPERREADPKRMFFYLLPGAMLIAEITSMIAIGHAAGYDTGNVTDMCCPLVTLPFAFGCSVGAIMETIRPNGFRVLLRTLPLIAVVAFLPWLLLQIAIDFNLFRHVY